MSAINSFKKDEELDELPSIAVSLEFDCELFIILS
jgi:hypothetical protein